jgi:hypothetical protein
VIIGKWQILKFVVILGSLSFVLASEAQGTLTYPVTFTVQSGSDTVTEVFDQPVQTTVEVLNASGNCIATIYQADSVFEPDPVVNLHFSVLAGSSDTTFTISSAVVSFPAITNPEAVASSSLTLNDIDGNGATLTGLESGGNVYKAVYNGGVSWAYLNSSYSFTNPYDSQVESNRDPTSGFSCPPDTITSIQSEYQFTLSANDQASGTSTFSVQPIPEPLTLVGVLTGLAGLGRYVRNRIHRQRMD